MKSATTSSDTIHSSGAMLVCLILSGNCWDLEVLYSDPAVSGLGWPNTYFDSLDEGESTGDTIMLRGLFGFSILGRP